MNRESLDSTTGVGFRWMRARDRADSLGFMYDNGEGAPEDDAEAVRW